MTKRPETALGLLYMPVDGETIELDEHFEELTREIYAKAAPAPAPEPPPKPEPPKKSAAELEAEKIIAAREREQRAATANKALKAAKRRKRDEVTRDQELDAAIRAAWEFADPSGGFDRFNRLHRAEANALDSQDDARNALATGNPDGADLALVAARTAWAEHSLASGSDAATATRFAESKTDRLSRQARALRTAFIPVVQPTPPAPRPAPDPEPDPERVDLSVLQSEAAAARVALDATWNRVRELIESTEDLPEELRLRAEELRARVSRALVAAA